MGHPTHFDCATCGAVVDVATPFPFRCPNATETDRRHVLQIRGGTASTVDVDLDQQTFVARDELLAWAAYANANGLDRSRRDEIVMRLDEAVHGVDGVGFQPTPFRRSSVLSDELGMEPSGGIWVKDETGAVGGSQKARHLFSILLHLRAAEEIGHLVERPRLAISSCGNAALAAATLARAADWPIDVFVPTWMSDGFGDRLDELGAAVPRCERRDDDPPGDPAMLRFRDAVGRGAIPFTVQGPENALCLDGGRTIGWEIADQAAAAGCGLDRIFVQVGGGAFAAAVGASLAVPLFAVQTEGCAPLRRAWDRANGVDDLGRRWSEFMTVWDEPVSLADGILDDETYDWIGVVEAMRRNGGWPVVAPESRVIEAHRLAHAAGYDASPTGSAGLAGLLHVRDQIEPSEQVAIIMSGVTR